MSFAIVRNTLTASQTGATRFDFSAACAQAGSNLGALVYGISAIYLTEGAVVNGVTYAQQPLQNLAITLQQTGGGVGYDYVDLEPTFVLTDSKDEASTVDVTVLAYVGPPNPAGIYLNNQSDLGGTPPTPISLADIPILCTGVLSGLKFNSDDSSAALGFGATAGAWLNPYVSPTKLQAVPTGDAVCFLTSNRPMTSTTVDVGTLCFTKNQTLTSNQLFFGSYVDTPNTTLTQPVITTPPLQDVAVFLQSFFVQFQISDWEAVTVTPDFGASRVGVLSGTLVPGAGGNFTFQSAKSLYSPYPNHNAGWGTGGGAYGVSLAASYVYVGILK